MVAREQFRLAAASPAQAIEARLPFHPRLVASGDAEDAADALDHDRARFGDARCDQRDAQRLAAATELVNPFGPGPGLAEPAPREHQPHSPAFADRRDLAVLRPAFEVGIQHQQVVRGNAGDDPLALFGARVRQPDHQLARKLRAHSSPPGPVARCSSCCFSRSSFFEIFSRSSASSSSGISLSASIAVSRCILNRVSATWFE